ncbi:hypothetical protein IQ241_23455 [Romeria aff. gracilis LEGE 07310]|uniref:Uncharacterized protein n=1 Tax=Vasconcelosia minhoensis LEGE 07310 TaxID=915328 RepID=A0A8J7AA15_9CYAN|nr:hypothetical protein [Romeria gracilis]MBE9080207.1 hypothetical protein [Romeria aff. gracilis LEGE 07310]
MIQVNSEQQVLREGFQILLENMEPSKVARFWAACNLGHGDYLKFKEELFEEETVDSLSAKILEFQKSHPKT